MTPVVPSTKEINVKRAIIIQTAFIGDVILATALIEELKRRYPLMKIHFLLRKGNEVLLENNPHLEQVWVWEKDKKKYRNLLKLVKKINQYDFDLVINIQRFFSSGLFTRLIKAQYKVGFKQNPMSAFYTHKVKHQIPYGDAAYPYQAKHEVDRNLELLNIVDKNNDSASWTRKPKLYFNDSSKVTEIIMLNSEYVVLAPTSVWFTKQWQIEKWQELIGLIPDNINVYLIGAKQDKDYCEKLTNGRNIINLCGHKSFFLAVR
jgi:heptosyltransferase-2